MSKLDEMVKGYLDGFNGRSYTFAKPEEKTPAYRHGWKNGQADRIGEPIERAEVQRARAAMILGDEA